MASSTQAKKYELAKTSLQYQTKEYFKNSTLHGVRYIAEQDRPFFDRFLWWCCTSIGATVTLIIIVSLWEKFQTNPTITGLDTDFHNWDVPFPGISVCHVNPISEERLDRFIESHYAKIQDQEKLKDYLTAVGQLNYKNIHAAAQYFSKYPEFPQNTLKEIAIEIISLCEDVLSNCSIKGEVENCCQLFHPLFTEDGLCYSYNIFPSQGIVSIDGSPIPEFEQRFIYETDKKWDLTIYVNNLTDNPARVYLHGSHEQPGIDQEWQYQMTNRVNDVLLFEAKTTYTTEDAYQLSIKQRHCVFKKEIKLFTDDIYSYGACMRECRMKKAFSLCNCVPYFYKETVHYPFCDLKGLACIDKRQDEIFTKTICACELGCDNTVYEIEKIGYISESRRGEEGAPEEPHLELSFSSWPMIRYKREVLFGWVDLLVSFGGIAGLFLGFSLLSGVEIIYYFSMRACCMFTRDKEKLEELKRINEMQEKPPIDLSLTPFFLQDKEKEKSSSATAAPLHFVKPL